MSAIASIAEVCVLVYFLAINGHYLVLTVLAFRNVRRARRHGAVDWQPLYRRGLAPAISVLCPAHNEAETIVDSVRALGLLRYPEHEVIVINDGSTDETLARLIEAFALVPSDETLPLLVASAPVRAVYRTPRYPWLVAIDKENGGKGDALNAAINASRHPLICAVDADSLLEPDSLERVAAPFLADPLHTIACGGMIRVLNGCTVRDARVTQVHMPRPWLEAFQALEYLRAFLLGRLGWGEAGSLLIVSGAFGLFRKADVVAVGGYRTDTVGEDMELVLRLHDRARTAGDRVAFVADPVCWTQAPGRLRGFRSQRSRWQRGLAQSLWLHRRMIGRRAYGRVGMVGLPSFVLFELLGPVIEAGGYVLFALQLWLGRLSPSMSLAFVAVAVGLGMVMSFATVYFEARTFHRYRGPDLARLMLVALLENFGYRQYTVYCRLCGLWDWLRGSPGWGQPERASFTSPSGRSRGR